MTVFSATYLGCRQRGRCFLETKERADYPPPSSSEADAPVSPPPAIWAPATRMQCMQNREQRATSNMSFRSAQTESTTCSSQGGAIQVQSSLSLVQMPKAIMWKAGGRKPCNVTSAAPHLQSTAQQACHCCSSPKNNFIFSSAPNLCGSKVTVTTSLNNESQVTQIWPYNSALPPSTSAQVWCSPRGSRWPGKGHTSRPDKDVL